MKVTAAFEGFVHGSEAGIREWIEQWAERHLAPLVPNGSERLIARVKRHTKGHARFSVSLRIQVPHKKHLVAVGEDTDVRAAVEQAEERLLRQAQAHRDRLRHQAEYRRKTRRARLRELKARIAALPADQSAQSRAGIEPLLARLERVVHRELTYLRQSGQLPVDYPTTQDVVDEAVAVVTAVWRPGMTADETLHQLLRAAFEALDREVDIGRRNAESLSLEALPPEDAEDTAESMVQEDIYEFYQPDEVLHLEDVLSDENALQPEAVVEADQRSFLIARLGELPTLWRRALLLSEWEQLASKDIATVLGWEPARVEMVIEQALGFLDAHFEQAGYTSTASRELLRLWPADSSEPPASTGKPTP